jgi:hypothetical protein
MSIKIVHIVPHDEAVNHDTSPIADCPCDPHLKPVEGGILIVHRDAIGVKMGLHALYHNANPETWWVWKEVNEGPAKWGMGRTV